MKSPVLFLLVLSAVSVTFVKAQNSTLLAGLFHNATIEQTEQSLVLALNSDIPGVQLSAALTVRQLKALMPERSFSMFVIPLMRIVKQENADRCSRVIAAIALHDLHSAIGDYAISRQARFTGCDRLARTCRWLTYYQALEDHPELAPGGTAPALAEK